MFFGFVLLCFWIFIYFFFKRNINNCQCSTFRLKCNNYTFQGIYYFSSYNGLFSFLILNCKPDLYSVRFKQLWMNLEICNWIWPTTTPEQSTLDYTSHYLSITDPENEFQSRFIDDSHFIKGILRDVKAKSFSLHPLLKCR